MPSKAYIQLSEKYILLGVTELSLGSAMMRSLILKPWEEVVGTLRQVDQDGDLLKVILELGGALMVIIVEPGEELRNNIMKIVGWRVGILRTDDSYAIRLVKEKRGE